MWEEYASRRSPGQKWIWQKPWPKLGLAEMLAKSGLGRSPGPTCAFETALAWSLSTLSLLAATRRCCKLSTSDCRPATWGTGREAVQGVGVGQQPLFLQCTQSRPCSLIHHCASLCQANCSRTQADARKMGTRACGAQRDCRGLVTIEGSMQGGRQKVELPLKKQCASYSLRMATARCCTERKTWETNFTQGHST